MIVEANEAAPVRRYAGRWRFLGEIFAKAIFSALS
jgi:hypothetical protein